MTKIFQAHDTHGIPIQDLSDQLNSEGYAINWLDWMKDAIKAKWTYQQIKRTINEVNDKTYGKKWRELEYLIPVIYLGLKNDSTSNRNNRNHKE